jgi:DNA polymerase III epsilon subunit-like protein
LSLLVFDFEASALEHGYPIEVAVADVASRMVKAWLIRPERSWQLRMWSSTSERIHNLSRETVQDRGEPADRVAVAMADFIAGRKLVSDNPSFDAMWLNMLFEAAEMEPPIVHADPIDALLSVLANSNNRSRADIDALERMRKSMADHTAAGDAAAWAAAAEALALEGDLSIERIDDIRGRWATRARAASPWRNREGGQL